MEMQPAISDEAKSCSHCRHLGIPEPTILPGAKYIRCLSILAGPFAMCLDCFDRLNAEISTNT
jgi:hypothetical protein